MAKFCKSKIEFYITNVCNFNCDNCNRLNNYYFSGHESWYDYADVYTKWSRIIDFENISILGGEPTLHPELDRWTKNLRHLWPKANIMIVTNGTRLAHWYKKGFFNLLADAQVHLSVNLHNRVRYQSCLDEIRTYLENPTEKVEPTLAMYWAEVYDAVKDSSWPQCQHIDEFYELPAAIQKECTEIHKIDPLNFNRATGRVHLTDSRGFTVEVGYYEDFVTAPLKYIGNDKFSVYDSDPNKSHEVCWSRHCTHMMKGKIYKCHHMALLPEFAQQFHVEMTTKQQSLLNSYQPLNVDADEKTIENFLDRLPQVMPQCALCPSALESIKLSSSTRKPKIKKKVFEIKPLEQREKSCHQFG